MATNEQRARLIGWEPTAYGWVYVDKDGFYPCPAYDTSLDAVAELLRFVREWGKEIKFVYALDSIVRPNTRFNLIAATPQQICMAFDVVFAKELSGGVGGR